MTYGTLKRVQRSYQLAESPVPALVPGIFDGGTSAQDTIIGGDGPDTLEGAGFPVRILGGAGNDRLFSGREVSTDPFEYYVARQPYQFWPDRLFGEAGDDFLMGSNGPQRLERGPGNDTLNRGDDKGSPDEDWLDGGDGNDVIRASDDATPTAERQAFGDHIYGDAGDDTLVDGTADDRLGGGPGADHFVFHPNVGQDTVVELTLSEGDVLDLLALELSGTDAITLREVGGSTVMTYAGDGHADGDRSITFEGVILEIDDFDEGNLLLSDRRLDGTCVPYDRQGAILWRTQPIASSCFTRMAGRVRPSI